MAEQTKTRLVPVTESGALEVIDRKGNVNHILPDKIVSCFLTAPKDGVAFLKITLMSGWYVDCPDRHIDEQVAFRDEILSHIQPDWRKSIRKHYIRLLRQRVPEEKGYIPLGVDFSLSYSKTDPSYSKRVDQVSFHGVKLDTGAVLTWDHLALDDLPELADII